MLTNCCIVATIHSLNRVEACRERRLKCCFLHVCLLIRFYCTYSIVVVFTPAGSLHCLHSGLSAPLFADFAPQSPAQRAGQRLQCKNHLHQNIKKVQADETVTNELLILQSVLIQPQGRLIPISTNNTVYLTRLKHIFLIGLKSIMLTQYFCKLILIIHIGPGHSATTLANKSIKPTNHSMKTAIPTSTDSSVQTKVLRTSTQFFRFDRFFAGGGKKSKHLKRYESFFVISKISEHFEFDCRRRSSLLGLVYLL